MLFLATSPCRQCRPRFTVCIRYTSEVTTFLLCGTHAELQDLLARVHILARWVLSFCVKNACFPNMRIKINNCSVVCNNLNDVGPISAKVTRESGDFAPSPWQCLPQTAMVSGSAATSGEIPAISILRPITSCSPSNQMRRICTRGCPDIFGTVHFAPRGVNQA